MPLLSFPLLILTHEVDDAMLWRDFSVGNRCEELDCNGKMLGISQTWLLHTSVPALVTKSFSRTAICHEEEKLMSGKNKAQKENKKEEGGGGQGMELLLLYISTIANLCLSLYRLLRRN